MGGMNRRVQSKPAKLFTLLGLLAPVLLSACEGESTPAPVPTPGGAGQATAAATDTSSVATAQETTSLVTDGGGGTLRWSNEGVSELDTLDPPNTQSSNSVMAAGLIFEGLVRLDAKLNIQPAGAASWDISQDGLTYTFHIRPGLLFADGTPVTSEDFRYSLERALSKDFANGSAGYYLSNIVGASDWTAGKAQSLSGVTTDGADKLVIKIQKAGVYFLDQLTFIGAAVVPKKVIDQYGSNWIEHAMGTGPFMLQQWKHNQSLSLVPNPNYWRGKLQLGGIYMPFVQEPETAFQLYQTNQLDIMGSQQFPPTRVASMNSNPDFKQVPQFFDAYIGFNNGKSPLDNAHLRRALALSVDKKTLADRILNGAAVATDHIVPPGMPGYFDALKPLAFNVDQAKQELAQAGNIGTLSLSFTTGQADFDKVAATVQQMWKQNLGINVTLNGEEQGKFNDDLTVMANDPKSSNLGMYISVWGADYPDPQNFLTQQLHTGVGNNNGHWSNADFDRLTDQADVDNNAQERMSLYNQAEQIAVDNVGWLPLYNGKGSILIRPNVQGITYTAQGLFADDWTKVTNK